MLKGKSYVCYESLSKECHGWDAINTATNGERKQLKQRTLDIPLELNYQVIRHLGMIDQPWNCPHGRPTMRHLSDIRETVLRSRDSIDWSSLQ